LIGLKPNLKKELNTSDSLLQPWYILPLLVEQPTWGGEYIAEFKGLTDPQITSKKIGQSFELAGESIIAAQTPTQPTLAIAAATDLAHPKWIGDRIGSQSIQSLISLDPERVLGHAVVAKTGSRLHTLIKFTQAQSNSYQVHLEPGKVLGHWQAKPESWYFLEKGQATLGIKAGIDVVEYQKCCQGIDDFAQEVSQKIKNEQLSLKAGRQALSTFINQDHPRRFVNTIELQAHQTVDLSQGGLHHSWEKAPNLPRGNIVYEVQFDVKDENCTLRAFDQGNIKDDSSVRPLTIQDYFATLDTQPEHNQPDQYFGFPLTQPTGAETTLFDNQHYTTSLISLDTGENSAQETDGQTFHHLFVQSGEIIVKTTTGGWPLKKGWSMFVPADIKKYQLLSQVPSTVLKTRA